MRKIRWYHHLRRQLALLVIAIIVIYPVLWVVQTAMTPAQVFQQGLSTSDWTMDNFRAVVSTETAQGKWLFGRQLWNSLLVSALTTALGIVLSLTAAYALSRFPFPGRDAGLASLLITQMFPGVLMAIPIYILLDKLRLLNSMIGLTLVYATTAIPFCIWMLKGYIDTIPKDLEEAALLDGATRWQVFVRIVLPLARPAIAITALFSFMTAWNEFILAATFLNDETAYTLPVAIQRYVGSEHTAWGHFAASAILVSLPVVALFFALQRHLVSGLTAGGVK